jgi:hypothetical protein
MKSNKTHIISFSLMLLAVGGFMILNLGNWLSTPAGQPIPADVIVSLGGDALSL